MGGKLTTLGAFLLFMVLVWLFVALGKTLAATIPERYAPPWARAIMDPNYDASKRQGQTIL